MGVRYEHPGFGLVFVLDEHGGDAEECDANLYEEWFARAMHAVRVIAAEPKYAGIARNEADYQPLDPDRVDQEEI